MVYVNATDTPIVGIWGSGFEPGSNIYLTWGSNNEQLNEIPVIANGDGAFDFTFEATRPGPPTEMPSSVCSVKAWTGGFGVKLEATWPLLLTYQ